MILTQFEGNVLWMWYYNDKMKLMAWNSWAEQEVLWKEHETLSSLRKYVNSGNGNEVLYDSGDL